MTTTAHVTEYAAAVRAALADVPEPDRTELLEDLEDHLGEIAVESTESLTARLGTPEAYAAELRSAYTSTPLPKAQPKRDLFSLARDDYRRRFPDGIGWPEVLGFMREFPAKERLKARTPVDDCVNFRCAAGPGVGASAGMTRSPHLPQDSPNRLSFPAENEPP